MSAPRLLVSLVYMLVALPASLSRAEDPKSVGRMIYDRLPFEVVADITWQGQPLQFRKVVSCDQHRRTHPGPQGDPSLRVREVWDQSVFRIYDVLPSHEVLIFELPGVCRTFEKRVSPPSADFLPVTLWVD